MCDVVRFHTSVEQNHKYDWSHGELYGSLQFHKNIQTPAEQGETEQAQCVCVCVCPVRGRSCTGLLRIYM